MTATRGDGALRQLVEDHHDQAEKAHQRMRTDLDGVGKKVTDIETQCTNLLLRVTAIERTSVNIEKVTFSSTQLALIVAGCLGIAAGMWTLRVGINDVQVAVANATKIQDERYAVQMKQIEDLGKELQLRRLEIKDLSKQMSDFQLQQQQRPRP